MSIRLADGRDDLRAARRADAFIIIMIFLTIIIVFGLTISSLFRERKRYLQTWDIKTSAQAQLLAESATSLLYDVDLTLLATKHLIESETFKSNTFSQTLQDFISAQLNFLPQVVGVGFVSPSGELLYSRGKWAIPVLPSLIFHRDEWLELFVGTMRQEGNDRRILLSRRIENREGEFIGVFAAEIAPQFFHKKYENYLGLDVAAIVLFDIDGSILSGWHDDPDRHGKLVGNSVKEVPLFSSLAQSLPLSGGLQSYEDRESIISSSQLTDFPFHIAVASRKNFILAKWYAESKKNLAILAVSILLAGAATTLTWTHRKKRRQAENQLRLHQLHLEETVTQRTKEISLMNNELMQKNEALQNAMAEIKTLSGFLPICSYCKKIKDDSGYWSQIEAYIGSRTGTEFSHSVCPECAVIHYPGIDVYGMTDKK